MEQPAVQGLFRSDFLDKGLVTFAECIAHYRSFDADALLDEMRLLLTAPMLSIPFGVSSARYFALMAALMRCAGTDRRLSDLERAKFVRICVDIALFLRGRSERKRMEAFDIVLESALDVLHGAGVVPGIAEAIAAELGSPASLEGPLAPAETDVQAPPLAVQDPPPGFPFALAV